MPSTSVSQVHSSGNSRGANQSRKTAALSVESGKIPPLLGASLAELTEWVQQNGQPAYRGKQLYQWIYERGARSISEISVFSKQWRETVA
ncbi:MAG: 23S rRNA (adenine(2503)-C(2))-methyltransferase RlmN, partial [Microcoleus sp.]